ARYGGGISARSSGRSAALAGLLGGRKGNRALFCPGRRNAGPTTAESFGLAPDGAPCHGARGACYWSDRRRLDLCLAVAPRSCASGAGGCRRALRAFGADGWGFAADHHRIVARDRGFFLDRAQDPGATA